MNRGLHHLGRDRFVLKGRIQGKRMIYTQMTRRAMNIAYEAHHGQYDKAGVPYIFHPIHVAEQMDDEISTCVALLHDVVEDTHVTLDDLRKEFPEEVIEALSYLTHEKDTDYFAYVRKLSVNPLARKVKIADLLHNSDPDRNIGLNLSEEVRSWLEYKYSTAKQILGIE